MKINFMEAVQIISGGTPSTKNPLYWGGSIPWLSVVDFGSVNKYVFATEKHITDDGLHNSATKMLHQNDIIISARGTVGAMAMLGKPMAFNQSCFGLRGKPEIINQDFLFYYLRFYMKNITQKAQGSVFSTINLDTFKSIELDIPSIQNQKAIARILSNIDRKIDNNNTINAELEAMAKTIYDYWFLQFEFPDENGKPYKSSGGKMVYNEELKREIPEGWEVSNIGSKDIYTSDYTANGSFAGLAENVKYNDGEPYAILVRIIDLKNDFSKPDDLVYVNKHAYNYLKKSNLRGGEIIICNVGDVGATFMCPNLSMPMTLGPNGIVINSEQYNDYLYLHFASLLGQHSLNSISSGSIQKKFNKTNFRELPLLFPENGVLREFNKIYDPIKLKISNIWHENRELASLRDFLLPLLMNGQVGFKEEV